MIKAGELISLRIPYPNMESRLAACAHMYICIGTNEGMGKFVKCQTYKPGALYPRRKLVEVPDKARNPFYHATAIDLDKVFLFRADALNRDAYLGGEVCDEVLNRILQQVELLQPEKIRMSDKELAGLNPLNIRQ